MAVYCIDGNEPTPAAVFRAVAHDGSQGVRTPSSYKISPTQVPSGSVQVAPGSASLINQFPGGGGETYCTYEKISNSVAITPTGSSGSRCDLVVERIYDIKDGKSTKDGNYFEVIQGVSASVIASSAAAQAYCEARAYPVHPLAGITLPANTATVQASHIKDLRELARPRTRRALERKTMTARSDLISTDTKGVEWPSGARVIIEIPPWATHVKTLCWIDCHENGLAVAGDLWVGIGPTDYVELARNHYITDNQTGKSKRTAFISGFAAVPSVLRGTVQEIRVFGYRVSSEGHLSTEAPGVGRASVTYDLQFEELAI